MGVSRATRSPHSALSAALIAASFSLAPELLAATLTVTNTDDSGPGSLRDAVDMARSGDEIVFDPSLAGHPIVLSSGEIVIDEDVAIIGLGSARTLVQGPILDYPYWDDSDRRLFVIRPGAVATLTGVSLSRGTAVHSLGGAAVVNEGTLTISHCELNDNYSVSGHGGAVYNIGELVVLDSAFARNFIEDHGSGSGLFNATSGRAQVRRSLFADNSTPYGGGGGIANAGHLDAEDCQFVRNRALRGAGAIESFGDSHLTRSIVRDNYSLGGGGGAVNFGSLSIAESTFAHNTIGLRVGHGGGIYNAGTLQVTNSTIHGNGVEDSGGHGGGIHNEGSGHVVLTNTTITGNYLGSGDYDGAAGLENEGTVVLRGSLLAGNYFYSICYGAQTPLEFLARSDVRGVVDSLGHNLIGGCAGVDLITCSETVACGGFQGSDRLGVEVADLMEAEPLRLWPWVELPPRGLLADNGGSTPTVALTPGSSAIDQIPPGECDDGDGGPLLTDQRGTPRPQGTGCEVGSFEFSAPRGTGFWGHQCSGVGYSQLTPAEMQALFAEVAAASPAFPECVPIGCDLLGITTSQKAMRQKAERSLLGLRLNLITGRVTRGRAIDLPALTSAAIVGAALSEVEMTVCDPDASRGDLRTAKEISEAINNQGEDMELASLESSVTVLPGAARSFTLAVVNMSPDVQSYDLTASATWPVSLSLTRINALAPGQVAPLAATVFVPGDAAGGGEVRVMASERNSDALHQRTATIRILVDSPAAPGGNRRTRRLE